MDKAEVIQKIDTLVRCYHSWENDAGETRDEYISRILDEYTQQVSIDFAMHVSNKLNPDAKILYDYVLHLGLYNKWKKNKQ